ncbi:MAG: radical SAM protein [Geobacteraceae bacterium GWC2_55_20]|nr:MAG: radical SAM protein [Geobacteraceae bacterium GWC2_55_20]OGU25889.1 MAG: radical SAM protein [Geobacteraceae bacterium GWF2_54_21]HBA71745.1 radical SAM protein [Geobacter sp.]HCE67259.1 radical SAM protein [Geobacter sp.]
MLLIFPPVAKACEPPAGIARLAAALRTHGIACRMLDANLEGQLWLLEQTPTVDDTWSRRAARNHAAHIASLRNSNTYQTPDRYRRAVSDLNRLLAVADTGQGTVVGLADYQHATLSPLRSADLIAASLQPQANPFFPYFSRRLPELLDDIGTVGFSLNYLSQALCVFAMIGHIRERYPHLRIVLGGGLVTSWMRRPGWSNPFAGLVDHLVAGAGEGALLSLSGVSSATDQAVAPDYSGLPLTEYFSPGMILPYSAAGGCYWNRCSFCPERAEGNDYYPIPVSRALSDLRHLTATHRPALIHLLDNAVSPGLLRGLAVNPPGAPWYGFARVDEQLADPEFCRALKHSGCVMLKLGLESGDQGVLDRMGKGIRLEVVERVLSSLRRAGIAVYCYLLFGTPGENEVEAVRTLEFVVRQRDAIGFLNLAVFNMPIHGDQAGEFGTGLFYEGDLSLYTAFRHPGGWGRPRVRRFLEQHFKRHPAVAEIVRNDPPQFSSNHAPFFCR